MLVLFAAVLPVIVLFCGLCVDVGLLQLKQLQMQSAADSAALAAEIEAERGTDDWLTQAQQDAAVNGFTDGSNNTTVSIGIQPSSGSYANRYDVFQATISQTVNTVFMGTLNGGTVTLTAQSQALMTPCIYLTGSGGLQTYTLVLGTGSIVGETCPAYINTNILIGTPTTPATSLEAIDVSGSAGGSSGASKTYPSVTFNTPALTDPLAATASPSFSACQAANTSYSKSNVSSLLTLSPGTYCNGITLNNDSNVVFNPGKYIITGGATWTNSTVSGTGVTLFFTQGGGGSYGQFSIHNSTVTLSAPTDTSNGGIPGILVFADRNWVATSAQDFIVWNTSFVGDGIWYLTGAGLLVYDCTNFYGPNYMGLVADNGVFWGTEAIFRNNYSNVPTGNPFRTIGALAQ